MIGYLIYLLLVLPWALLVSVFRWLRRPKPSKKDRVAVIGGGIAGCGAAWALHRSDFKVVLFEQRSALGGNAKTHTWNYPEKPVTGLSVLAWPEGYFHNYNKLLAQLGIKTLPVSLPFYIKTPQGDYGHDVATNATTSQQLQKWVKMISVIRKVNSFFAGPDRSIYNMSFLNPLNVIPLKLLSKVFRISPQFWNCFVVPVYSSTFLSIELDYLPAVVGPLISDIVPLHQTPSLSTWETNSSDVFSAMTKEIQTKCGSAVTRVTYNGRTDVHTVVTADGQEDTFDYVIFASPASTALKASNSKQILLSNVSYCHETDSSFTEGKIHGDSTILPVPQRNTLLQKYANYIEVNGAGATYTVENTFLLSSWIPSVQKEKADRPMMITYNSKKPITGIVGEVNNAWAHPHLTTKNLIIGALLRLVQGHQGRFYCASYSTPGNGHDMSLLSGFVVAHAIGAKYPFADDADCNSDFRKLCRLMGL